MEFSREDGVDDAVAGRAGSLFGAVNEVAVEQVQSGDEKLVSVLLLVAGQVVSVLPSHVEQQVRHQRRLGARIKLLEQPAVKSIKEI